MLPKPAKTKTSDVDLAKIKNLRFTFKDGQAQLAWDEIGTDAITAHVMSMNEDGNRRFFVGANWKSSGNSKFVKEYGNDVL